MRCEQSELSESVGGHKVVLMPCGDLEKFMDADQLLHSLQSEDGTLLYIGTHSVDGLYRLRYILTWLRTIKTVV